MGSDDCHTGVDAVDIGRNQCAEKLVGAYRYSSHVLYWRILRATALLVLAHAASRLAFSGRMTDTHVFPCE